MIYIWFNTVDLVGLSLTVLRERREGFVCVCWRWGRDRFWLGLWVREVEISSVWAWDIMKMNILV